MTLPPKRMMLKRLAILGVMLVVLCANGRADQIHGKQGNQQSAAPVSATSAQQQDGATLQSKEQKDIHADVRIVNPPEKDFYDKALVWINLALVIVALGTGIMIGYQSVQTREAAEGAKQSALAAFAQITMMRDKERARIGVDLDNLKLEVVPGPHSRVEVGWRVTLYGQTDAIIHKSLCFAEVEGQDLPEHIRPAWGEMFELPNVISCDSRTIKGIVLVHPPRPYPFDYVTLSDRLASGEQKVICMGFVEYSDLFGGRWIFKFKRRWQFFGDDRGFGGLLSRSLLSGEWAPCGNPQDNGEYAIEPKNPN